jgi:hypothetical protein
MFGAVVLISGRGAVAPKTADGFAGGGAAIGLVPLIAQPATNPPPTATNSAATKTLLIRATPNLNGVYFAYKDEQNRHNGSWSYIAFPGHMRGCSGRRS